MGSTGQEKLVELQLLNNAQLTNPVNKYAPLLKTMLAKKYEMAQHYDMNRSCMLQLLCMHADQTTADESDSDSESQYSHDDSDTNRHLHNSPLFFITQGGRTIHIFHEMNQSAI